MRPDNVLTPKRSIISRNASTHTHVDQNGKDNTGQKFYCTEFSVEVTREDCINCTKWDDCPEREASSGAVIGITVLFGLALAVAFIIGQIF